MEYNSTHSSLRCDLHTHSVFSDGTYTPEELIAEAGHLGLIIALTDHNTVSGLPDFMAAAREQGVTAVPGTEISTEYDGVELHLLGLFIQPEHYAAVDRMVRAQFARREAANVELVRRLRQAGYQIDYENIKRRNPDGNPNRAHVAAELAELGYVSSIQDAFDTLLHEGCGFYVRPSQLQLLDVIRELRQIGVLPVLAHPFQDLTEGELRALLPLAKEAGLMGMETVHSSYSPDTIRLAQSIAAEYGLLPSGGSDFHGLVKPDVALGTGKGWHSVPADVYANLHAAWKALQK